MVRASDCGPEGRRFDPDIPPQCECSTAVSIQVFQTWDEGSTPSTRTIFLQKASKKTGVFVPIDSLHSHHFFAIFLPPSLLA